MASFGLTTAADFLRKLRHERADFVQSECLNPRHALNAVMTGYHLYEWVYPEIAGRTDCPHKDAEAFREAVKAIAGSPIADAGRIANGTKHFKLERIKTGKHKGSFQRNMVEPNAFDVSHLWLERDGHKQRAEEFIDELVQFWERFFEDHSLARYADAVGRSGRQRCGCGEELIDIDNRGEVLTGCIRCNRWWPLAKRPIQLRDEDLHALRLQRGWNE